MRVFISQTATPSWSEIWKFGYNTCGIRHSILQAYLGIAGSKWSWLDNRRGVDVRIVQSHIFVV